MNKKMNDNRPILLHGITFIFFFFLFLLPRVPYAVAQPSNMDRTHLTANPNFKPSLTVTIIVLAVAFVFIAVFSYYIRRCSRDNHMGGSIRPTNGTGRSRRAARGLDPSVIETFPTFVYSVVKGLKIGKGTLECAVCLNEFEDDENLRLLPKCDHVFHPECIDAWLNSHTTCPVCRANLVPVEGEESCDGEATQLPESDRSVDEIRVFEIDELNTNQVSICVIDDQNKDSSSSQQQPDVINPVQMPIQNRPERSKSTRKGIIGLKFPRSHSTGHSLVQPSHSLVQPGENCERFTLKLPADVRSQIMNGSLNRTTSCVTFTTRQGSVNGGSNRGKGYRSKSVGKNYQFGRFDRAAKSDRWGFSMAPPFFWRNNSVKKADGSVKSSFDCLSVKTDGAAQSSSTRPPV